MKDALECPKDVDDLLRTSLFLSNRLDVCRSNGNIMEPAKGQFDFVHWCVYASAIKHDFKNSPSCHVHSQFYLQEGLQISSRIQSRDARVF